MGSKILKLKAFKAQLNPEFDFVKSRLFFLDEEGLKGHQKENVRLLPLFKRSAMNSQNNQKAFSSTVIQSKL